MSAKPILYIVIPCYNEEAVLPVTAPMFLKKLEALVDSGRVSASSRIMFVNDGSKDATWALICALAEKDPRVLGVCLSRNRGHQNAVLAGLMEAMDRCDITISIDCDGQDDLDAMDAMVDAYLDGCEVVYNHADYRLVSSLVLHHFADFGDANIFLRGMFPLVGFKSTCVYYERHERLAGESHYPLGKMLALAFNGITSLSVKPINLITGVGVGFSLLGLVASLWAVVKVILGQTVHGWASLFCIVCLLGGIQLVSLGVIGQYVGKTYLETKRRPRYIISERTWEKGRRRWIEEERDE